MTVSAIIVAGGAGTRMAAHVPKQYLDLGGLPILARTLDVFVRCPSVDRIFLVVPAEDFHFCRHNIMASVGGLKPIQLVPGGAQRQQSVLNGLEAVQHAADAVVVVHDGVRPFVTCRQIRDCAQQAARSGACIIGVPVVDTLKSVDDRGRVLGTVSRKGLWQAQTPQAFRYELIRKAHESAQKSGVAATDDALLAERLGMEVTLLAGSRYNLKITTREDLALARAIWSEPSLWQGNPDTLP